MDILVPSPPWLLSVVPHARWGAHVFLKDGFAQYRPWSGTEGLRLALAVLLKGAA